MEFGTESEEVPVELQEHLRGVEVVEAGFHPDFVFFHPSLTPEQKEEGIARLCGRRGVEREAHAWLLKSLLKELRRRPTPVPVVLGPSGDFVACRKRGLLVIPHDFDVWRLADFLEENLDGVRQGREKILEEVRTIYSASEQHERGPGV